MHGWLLPRSADACQQGPLLVSGEGIEAEMTDHLMAQCDDKVIGILYVAARNCESMPERDLNRYAGGAQGSEGA